MIIDKLNELHAIVNSGNIPCAKEHWGMHDAGFIDKLPETYGKGDFYPDPDYIVTPHSLKVSWLMEKLTSAWHAIDGLNRDRYDFFIPVLNAANDAVQRNPEISAEKLCCAVLFAAEKVIADMIVEDESKGIAAPDGLYLYFAYGSNMNIAQMAERCPGAITLGKAVLSGYKLTERKYADIDAADGAEVEGVLYAISRDHLKELDRREGYNIGIYDRRAVTVQVGDKRCAAIVYEMTTATKKERDGIPYTDEYREKCSLGARQHGVTDCFAR